MDVQGKKQRLPARTPEATERRMINLAVGLAEKQLEEGTASSQVITHFLKLATERDRLERDRIRSDLRLNEAKIHQIESADEIKILMNEAIDAMRSYGG